MRRLHLPLSFSLSMLFACGSAAAQDASLLAGGLRNLDVGESSFAAQLGYAYRINHYTSLSAEYLNEGHPEKHHRDGLTSQFWLHSAVPQQGLSFGAGFGPYYFFDTTTGSGSSQDYRNLHGWGSILSVNAKWHLEERTYLEVRANRVRTHGQGDSNSLVFGVGYELRNLPPDIVRKNEKAGDRYVMLMGGQAIVNSFESERARAWAVEYRDTINQNVEWSAQWLSEGKIGLVERRGAAAQLWLLRPFTERTVLEIGGGPYVMRDRVNRSDANEESSFHLVPLLSIGMRWRLGPDTRVQLSWSRVVTSYHRDSDVLLLGAGLRF